MPRLKSADRPVAILDIETDPLKYGRVPKAFAVGIYTREKFNVFWGDDCISQSVAFLRAEKVPHIIYAHNGGGFDFKGYYTMHLEEQLRIINGKIIQCRIGKHEMRDSHAIMPFPLHDYRKDEIDYSKFEKRVREKYKEEIIAYLKSDCANLMDLIEGFHAEFGKSKLTIGSTALTELLAFHEFEETDASFDRDIRPAFFLGARNQAFQTGVIEGRVELYDVNGLYAACMANMQHPIGNDFGIGDEIVPETCFLEVQGFSNGAFPTRKASGEIEYRTPKPKQKTFHPEQFAVTRHEYDAAVQTGAFQLTKVIRTYDFFKMGNFREFVHYTWKNRIAARRKGDRVRELLYKCIGNAASGKFSQNPANFFEWKLSREIPMDLCPHCRGTGKCRECLMCEAVSEYRDTHGVCAFCTGDGYKWHAEEFDSDPEIPKMWKAQSTMHRYLNIATGASITGAGRSVLLRGLRAAEGVLYCDTDSLICRSFSGAVHESKLGAWKFEGDGCLTAIAAKKTYAVFSGERPALNDEDARRYPWMLEPVK
jgi:hypothetical protein